MCFTHLCSRCAALLLSSLRPIYSNNWFYNVFGRVFNPISKCDFDSLYPHNTTIDHLHTYVGVMSIWFDFIHRMHCIIYDKHIRTPTTYLRTRILANSNANVCSHLWSYWIYIWSRWPCDHFHMDIYMIISSISSPNWIKPTNTRTSNELFLLRLFLLMCHLIILMSLGLILMLLNFEFCYRFDACMRKTNQQQCKGSTGC